MKTNTNQIEDLQCGGLKIIQNKSLYTFTSDAVILANFIRIKRNQKALEIGTGSGVISILLTAKTQCKNFVAFEMQEAMASLAKENVKLNNLQDKIQVVNDKIQNYNKYYKKGEFDVVFSNPPYMLSNDNQENTIRSLARHDKCLKIQELAFSAASALKVGGTFYCIYTATRAAELIYTLINCKLQPKTIFFTENGKGSVNLIVVEAVKGGKFGVKVLPNLITNDLEGNYLESLHTQNFK